MSTPQPVQVQGDEYLRRFREGDEFLFSLSEFVEPMTPIRFRRNKGGFLAFDFPEGFESRIKVDTPLHFKVDLEERYASLTFHASVYRLFGPEVTGKPLLVVRAPEVMDYRERRQDPRVAVEVPCRYRRRMSVHRGTTVNLSRSGALFLCAFNDDLGVHDRVVFELTLPNLKIDERRGLHHHFEEPFEARVVRIQKQGEDMMLVAVEFVGLLTMKKQKDCRALDVFISRVMLGKH